MREHNLGIETDLSPSLPQPLFDRIAKAGTPCRLARRQALYHQGEDARQVFVLTRGRIKASAVNAHGHETVLRVHLVGSLLGLTAIGVEPCLDATATALEDCDLASLDRQRMLDLIRADAELGVHIVQLLLERVASFQFRVHEVQTNTVEQRVARALLGFSTGDGGPDEPPRIHLSHEELSHIVAARRPTVTQSLRHFAEAGLIRVERRSIAILDRDGLTRFLPDHE